MTKQLCCELYRLAVLRQAVSRLSATDDVRYREREWVRERATLTVSDRDCEGDCEL